MILENEITQLERSINTLIRRPTLIRREYWATQTERLLVLPGLSDRDRRRLSALLVLLGVTSREQAPQTASPEEIVHCD